jgi:hypothetical protein
MDPWYDHALEVPMSDKTIPADKVVVHEVSSVSEFRERLDPETLKEHLSTLGEAAQEEVPVTVATAKVEPLQSLSGLPTDLVDFPPIKVVVDMMNIVDRTRFAA